MLIDKNNLVFDHQSYQREAIEAKVNDIAKDWSWIACGAILVAERDGKFFVMDGQYRTLAARKRDDIKQVPCMVFGTEDVKKEAKGFLVANTLRKPVNAVGKYRALITVEDPNAVFVESLLDQIGRSPRNHGSGSSASCLSTLLKLAGKDKRVLAEVVRLADELCTGRVLQGVLIETLMYIEVNLRDGETIVTGKWRDRIMAIGFDELAAGAKAAATFECKGGPFVWARGMLKRINKGLRIHLRLENGADED
jgi:hypothetical protein